MSAPDSDAAELDLDAYLRRIGCDYTPGATRAGLDALHLAHATHIPFENLDVLLGRPINLALARLQDKLVRDRRGGYCFEHNLLFAAALRRIGFAVTPLAARVRYRARRVLPRTHMLLCVDVGGERVITDVGFGLAGLLAPMALAAGAESRQFAWRYRLAERDGSWTLQMHGDAGWIDLYEFTLEPQHAADIEMANYYASTHPDSRFVHTLTVQLPAPQVRYALRNRELTEDRGGAPTTRVLAGDDELSRVLAEVFGLRLPAGTAFGVRD
ncbi:MAG TPA: arylamine N-acetyltransferase [Burkholderiales bacterium]|nr:arylamine N-acetyltransferase [Burkholderiales bacterium]